MKRDRQSVNARHAEMLALIRDRQEIMVEELSEIFGISNMTVRRDLQYLEDKGKISRFHGGATVEPRATTADKNEVSACRRLIARYAASLVAGDESLLINGSTTALSMLDYLKGNSISVYTNNALVVGHKPPPGVDIHLFGGMLRGSNHILTGDLTLRNLMDVHANKAFLGCDGISPSGEILCGIPSELGINETMIEHSDAYYILADFTKVGKTSPYASFHLEKKGCVITDEHASEDVLQQLRDIGMKIVQVQRADFSEVPENLAQ